MAMRPSSRHRAIPVTVKVERRPPARRSAPSPALTTEPVILPTTPAGWSETHRRRIMWISVGLGTLVGLIGSISLFSAQIHGNAPTFFGDASRLIRTFHWPWTKAPATKNEQEIRQLEEQVFPQFQK